MQRSARPAVEAADVRPADVREPQPPARPGDADLPRVQVAGEDEVERARGHAIDDIRVVAEKDPEVGAEVQRRVADYLERMAGRRPQTVDVVIDQVA